MSNIKLITFDLDDTFWDIGPVIIKAEIKTREFIDKNLGKKIVWGNMEEYLAVREGLISNNPAMEYDLTLLRKGMMNYYLDPYFSNPSQKEELVDAAFEFFLEERHKISFYDGVIESLDELSKDFSLGILTNGNADMVKLGIDGYFDFSISSEDVQSAKPNEGHFKKAIEVSSLNPENILHIGDHQLCDMVGGMNAGFNVLWFNKKEDPWKHARPEPEKFSSWKEGARLINNFIKKLN
ncbi:MAG: HAD family hydrolase [Gammaproteobacteria bacterium]